MSKTKGNVVDPLAVIDETGADALRFALIHGATPGQDQRSGGQARERAQLREQALERDALRRRGPAARSPRTPNAGCPVARRSRPGRALARCRARARRPKRSTTAMAELRVRRGHAALYDAIWNEFCDWGLELAKVRLSDESLPARRVRRRGGRSSRRSTPTCACSTR
jgi:valyl-tRNA synthetase